MENYLNKDKENMDTSKDTSGLHFFLYIHIFFYDLGVLVCFTSFKTEFLTAIEVDPSKITPNSYGILRASQIVYRHMGMSSYVRLF